MRPLTSLIRPLTQLSFAFGALVFIFGAHPLLAQTPAASPAPASLHFVFGIPGAPFATEVEAGQSWDEATGHGFTSIKDGNEQAFSVRVPEGDYRIEVTLGHKSRASRTSVWAEDRRLVIAPVELKKGQTRKVSFVTNVRGPYLSRAEQDPAKPANDGPKVGLRGDEPIGRTWDDRLTISFAGPQAAFSEIRITPVKVRRVFLAGDSTVADQAGADYASWGQMLPRFLDEGVSVVNYAYSGETMKSFVTSLRWDKLLSQLREGDIVLIQFGHNDQKKQWPRTYVSAEAGYPAWLSAFAADAQTRGAKVVLITPVARRFFKDGRIENTHGLYDQAVRDVAQRLGLPLIDLTRQTTQFYETLGPDISPLAFAADGSDKTHHNAYGAWMIAGLVATAITDTQSDLGLKAAAGFKPFEATKPADPKHYELQPADWPLMREVVAKVSGN